MKCSNNQVLTKRGTCVTPIPLKKGVLGKYGYKNVKSMSELARHRALRKVIREGKESPLSLFRRLNVLMILFRYKDPKLSQLFRNDRNYIKKMLR
jgi:hypothetical protein